LDIYEFATKNIPYYIENPDVYALAAKNQSALDEFLRALPILTKDDVREHNERFWPQPLGRTVQFRTTSGTSGTPVRIPGDIWERAFSHAILEDWMRSTGTPAYSRSLNIAGVMTPVNGVTEVYWHTPFIPTAFLSIYAMNQGNKDSIRKFVRSFVPHRLLGYASAIHELAQLFDDGTFPQTPNAVAFTSSEVLYPHLRSTIQQNLGVKVRDFYGSREGQHLAVECDHGSLHIHPLRGIVEILDHRGDPVPKGQVGRVVVTGLSNRSFPLLRYDLGDTVVSTGFDTSCSCGSTWPTIGQIQGRSEDLVITAEGARVGYLLYHSTRDLRGVREVQLVQKGINKFQANIVISPDAESQTESIERAMIAEIERRLNSRVTVDFSHLDAIPKGPNGKFKGVVVDFEPGDELKP
jgi:phenylacetate-CoA ligase